MALAVHVRRISESKLHGAEEREEYAAGVNVFQTLSRSEGRSAAGEDDVFGERRAVFKPMPKSSPMVVPDRRLEKKEFERLVRFEAEKIEIPRSPSAWVCDIEVGASVG